MRDPFSLAPSKPSNIRAPQPGGAFGAPPPHTSNDGFFSSDASPILNEANHTGMMSSMPASRHAPAAPAPLAPQFPGGEQTFPQQFDTFANSAMGQVAMGYGKKAIEGGLARWLPGATALMSSLRVYFAVNNEYVLKKLWVSAGCYLLCVCWERERALRTHWTPLLFFLALASFCATQCTSVLMIGGRYSL